MFGNSLHDKAAACNNRIGYPALETQLPVCTRMTIDYDRICRLDRLHKPDFPNTGDNYTNRS